MLQNFLDARHNFLNKKISSVVGSRLTLTNNEIKGIMEVIKPLENRGIL